MKLISEKDLELVKNIDAINLRNSQVIDLSNYELTAYKNKPNGYAGLNESNQLSLDIFPSTLLGNVKFKGTYDGTLNKITSADNALNNQPLPASTDSIQGTYFILSTTFNLGGINYSVGDYIISNGNNGWNKISTSSAVTSVLGRTGNVSADGEDYKDFYVKLTGSYNNPSFIATLDYSKITNIPSTNSLATSTFKLVNTYAEMISYSNPGMLTVYKVLNDEDKGIQNSIYNWFPDGVRMWMAAQQDN